MPRALRFASSILMCGWMFSGCTPGDKPEDIDTVIATEFQNRYIEPYVAGDAEAWMDVFTEDAVALHDGLPALSGKEAIRGFADSVAENFTIVRLDAVVDEVRLNGNWAWSRGHFDANFQPKSPSAPKGVAGDRKGKFLLLWEKQEDGRWLIQLDMGNSIREMKAPDASVFFACKSCHGEQGLGNEALAAPAIAGMNADYLARQLRHYRDGLRGDTLEDLNGRQMGLIAAILTEDDFILELALYVASMQRAKPVTTLPAPDPSAAEIYARCAVCHGADAEGNADHGLALAWLDDWYIASQLKNFRNGIRGNAATDLAGQQMAAAAIGLTDEEIEQVSAYIVRLDGMESGP
jgi:cytochrome c oxidase subunit 2